MFDPSYALNIRLQQLQAELATNRAELEIQPAGDDLERALDMSRRETVTRRINTITAQLREVESARERHKRGEYGICADCDEEIAAKRLERKPEAVRCVRCQERLERNEAA